MFEKLKKKFNINKVIPVIQLYLFNKQHKFLLKTNVFKSIKALLNSLKKNYFTQRIIGICIVSLFLLIQLSPVFSLLWLYISTLYFLYIRSYRDIYKIWGFTISIWYLIFTTSLAEITILIRFENTPIIINYLLDNNFLFESLSFQTIYIGCFKR